MSFSVSARRKNAKTEQVRRIRALIYFYFFLISSGMHLHNL